MSVKDIVDEMKVAAKESANDQSSGGPAPTDGAMAWALRDLKASFDHGSTELMSGIYGGQPFTPYGHARSEAPTDAKPWEQEQGNALGKEQGNNVQEPGNEQGNAQEQVKEQVKEQGNAPEQAKEQGNVQEQDVKPWETAQWQEQVKEQNKEMGQDNGMRM